MERRNFSCKFKLEAAKLARECGDAVTRAARNLVLHATVLHRRGA